MTDDDRVHVVAGGNLVVACNSKEVADIQYTVMVGANLDAERWTMTPEQWQLLLPKLQHMNPPPEIADLTQPDKEQAE